LTPLNLTLAPHAYAEGQYTEGRLSVDISYVEGLSYAEGHLASVESDLH
jgi:hypothetical protein